MKRTVSLLTVAVFAAAMLAGCAKGYESQKVVDGLTIVLGAGRYPLVKGDNALTVKVADSTGKAVTDATVSVRYYMPPMPGMAPMESTTQATLKGNTYALAANTPMEGGWKVEVTVTQPGKPAVMATFNVDAR